MVAAAVAWIRAERPTLTADQAAQVLRLSAKDVAPAGWDANTGFGILSVGGGETIRRRRRPTRRAQRRHQLGRRARVHQARPPIYAGRGQRRLRALLDVFEDPADVYRVRLRPRSRVKVPRTRHAAPRRRRRSYAYPLEREAAQLTRPLARSTHSRPAHRAARAAQPRAQAATFYVAVTIQRGVRVLDACYALRVG